MNERRMQGILLQIEMGNTGMNTTKNGASFLYMPKRLFTDARYRQMSNDAKILYCVFLDKLTLSIEHNWFDEKGCPYITYQISEAAAYIGRKERKTYQVLNELECYGLIERRKPSTGRKNAIFFPEIVNLQSKKEQSAETGRKVGTRVENTISHKSSQSNADSLCRNGDEPDFLRVFQAFISSTTALVEKVAELSNLSDAKELSEHYYTAQNAVCTKIASSASTAQNAVNTAKNTATTAQNAVNTANNAVLNNNHIQDTTKSTKISIYPSVVYPNPKKKSGFNEDISINQQCESTLGCNEIRDDEREEMWRNHKLIRHLVERKIEYDVLVSDQPEDKETIDEIVMVMTDTCAGTGELQRINGRLIQPTEIRERFMKLGREHIKYILYCLKNLSRPAKNIRRYLVTCLFNAPATMKSFYATLNGYSPVTV